MCYRPQPNLRRTPARKSVSEEADRKLQELEAELALLRKEHETTRAGWLYLMRNTGFLLLALSALFLLGGHSSSNALRSMFEIMGTLTLVLGLWSVGWSWPMAEKSIKA